MMKVEKEAQRMMAEIDEAGSPQNMTQQEWCEFLEILKDDIDTRLGAVREELGQ